MDYRHIYVSLTIKSVGKFNTLLHKRSRPGSSRDSRYFVCYTALLKAIVTFFNQAINITELRLLKRNSIKGLQKNGPRGNVESNQYIILKIEGILSQQEILYGIM